MDAYTVTRRYAKPTLVLFVAQRPTRYGMMGMK